MCLIRSLGALSLSKTKKNIVIFTNVWRCHTDSNFLDSMLCSNLLPSVLLTYRQSEDKRLHALDCYDILADIQSFLLVSLTLKFEQLFRKLQHCLDQSSIYCKLLSMRPVAEQQHCIWLTLQQIQSTRSCYLLLLSKSSKILLLNLLQL